MKPVYLQLAEEIKIGIMSGRYKLGERLPSVRDFADEKMVNPNTMQRALSELEDMGLVVTERTNGKFVTDNPQLIERERKIYAEGLTAEYRSKMREIGMRPRL